MVRLAAFIVLLIPGIAAALGIKLMRDSLFGHLFSPFPFIWMQFLGGFILFAGGLGFFAGFLLRRDRRSGRAADRFKKDLK
ncbi:DUF2627 domain-containing protein [Sporosarcina sp. P21c]|uniref:DUF2627 domain-containing protein n=1 Tax=Sporosarcina TaxID=1569 RepID=UPI000A157453|nr:MULTISPECIES: DUF2627 domain-containing protein [Sporosarcina]ARJ37474.1 hypothetical protein SporoP8_00425 [Sporosarcina ureae]PIC66898.1 DUF2627 domain-containing protein [Sporosarcina sp. P16a]PIC84830.1 DUF2627 domain-containing protein [Sporosarcina sp. P1]PIC89399.1 DUF2627 domain-containing protein [Sporosarcina sp. P21c]PIC92350.1 DUF2627 domain-containing protein [Sporosarcina sp. P25]